MLTTASVIDTMVAQYVAANKAATPGEEKTTHKAIDKAAAIILAKTLTPNDDGTWTVRDDTSGSEKAWTVNGRCTCPAALKDQRVNGKDKGVCKHRIAVKMARRLQAHFQHIFTQQHTHHCQACRMPTICWAESCPEIVDVATCPACEAALALSPLGAPMPPCPEDCDGCLQDVLAQEDMDRDKAHSQEEQAAMYEENPTPPAEPGRCPECSLSYQFVEKHPVQDLCTTCVTFHASLGKDPQPVQPLTLPEAPCSINLKVKLPGGHELMVTLRSMQVGSAGDEEVMNRLPGMLAKLEALSEPSAQDKPSWLYRLMSSFRPTSNQTGGK